MERISLTTSWRVAGRAASLAAAGVVAALLAGCAGGPGGQPAGVRLVGDDPRIVVQLRGGWGMDALLEGPLLRYDPGSRCLFLDQDGKRSTPAWPRGTRPVVEDGRRGVHVPGHGLILDGDELTAGGGYQSPDLIDGLADLALELPAGCLPGGVFVMNGEFRGDPR